MDGRQPIRFRLLSFCYAFAACYHLAALLIPSFRAIAFSPTYPLMRHVVFVVVTAAFSYLMLRRPRWLIWPGLVLAAQVVNGHGVRLWQTWSSQHQIQLVDLVTVGVSLWMVAALWLDRSKKPI